jgi:hypothetical protein
MKIEEREKLAKESGEIARAETLKHCKTVKLTPIRVLKKISEGLDALENKVFYDKDRGKCVVGPDQINWSARQKAIDQAVSIIGIKAPEKLEVTHNNIAEELEAARQRVKGRK